MYYFDKIPPAQFALLGALLGLLLTKALNVSEQNSLGNFFVSIAQSILTNAAQIQTQKELFSDQEQLDDMLNQMDQLKRQVELLKKNYH